MLISRNSFHLSSKKLDSLHLKDFLKYKCELYLKQLLTPPQQKLLLPTAPRIIDLPLRLDGGGVPQSPEILDYATSVLIMHFKLRHIKVETPMTDNLSISA